VFFVEKTAPPPSRAAPVRAQVPADMGQLIGSPDLDSQGQTSDSLQEVFPAPGF